MLTPLENTALFGHVEVEAQLLRLIAQKKLPHAIMFCGAEGIGKATLAYRLAKYLLTGAEQPEPVMGLFGPEPTEENLACDAEHSAMRRILAGSHGDLLVIQPEFDEKKKTSVDTVFIDQVRPVIEFMHQTASESEWRIVIVDPIEALNTAAANALLKVLEEPPSQALLLLISHQPGKLLPTIKSRCRKINLRTPSEVDSKKIFGHLGQQVPPEDLHQLLVLTQGSAGRALHYYQNGALMVYRDILEILMQPSPKNNARFASAAAKAGSESWPLYKDLFLQVIYRLSVFASAPAEFIALDGEEKECFVALLARHKLDNWLNLWEKAEMLLQQVGSLTLDKQQVMLSLLNAAQGQARAA
jgi:DNA polymerase-3 subunit delta'